MNISLAVQYLSVSIDKILINNNNSAWRESLSATTHPVPAFLLLLIVDCVSRTGLLACQTAVAVDAVHRHLSVEC